MENTIPKIQRVVVNNDSIKVGDTIYLSTSEKSPAYTVLDVCLPFMMLENHRTHFCNMYRCVTPIYKEELCQ